MGKVAWTEEALRWLAEIRRYIALDNPSAAQRTVQGIFDRTRILEKFPDIGQRYKPEDEFNVRVLLYGHYRIAYLVHADRSVEILGVFHGAMDIGRYLDF